MDDIPYQAISVKQTDLSRNYLIVSEAQQLSASEKAQAVANLDLPAWFSSTYPDLAGGQAGSQGISGDGGSVFYSQGQHCVVHTGEHYYSSIKLRGNLTLPSGGQDDPACINFDSGKPILSFGTDDLPPQASAMSYSDGWMLNVGMVKELISTYGGGEGSSLEVLTDNQLLYSKPGQKLFCFCPMHFSSQVQHDGPVYYSASATFNEPVTISGMMYCYSDVSCMGHVSFSNTAAFQHETVFYDRVLVYSEVYFSGSNSDSLKVSGNQLYFNDKKVLTEP